MRLVDLMKQAANEAEGAGYPADMAEGVVTSISPLEINVNQMLTLQEEFLVVCEHLKDHEVEVEISWNSEIASLHTHAITGAKKMTVKAGLKIGDKVAMVQARGGQKFYVVGRL